MAIRFDNWWLIGGGYVLSLLLGLVIVGGGHCWLRHFMEGKSFDVRRRRCLRCLWHGMEKEGEAVKAVPAGLTGTIERLVFTTFAVVSPTGAPTAMGAWLTMKIAANWGRNLPEEPTEARYRTRKGFAAVLAGLGSMAIAWVGGVVVRSGVEIWLQ